MKKPEAVNPNQQKGKTKKIGSTAANLKKLKRRLSQIDFDDPEEFEKYRRQLSELIDG